MRVDSKDSERMASSLSDKEVVPENYFAGANRREVLFRMQEALQSGVAIMVLTGDEGSGKTTLCRLLDQQILPPGKSVFFSQTVDSFDDVVRHIATNLDLEYQDATAVGSIESVMEQITDCLLVEDVELLVIFDEAENMYLATLERIRKMLDRVIGGGGHMHLLFSGRKTFLENCDQLSLCDFQHTDAIHVELSPLSERETADYLQYFVAGLSESETAEVFTDDVVRHIYQQARGNLAMTGLLGDKAVRSQDDDTSFMVPLESVREQGALPTERNGDNDIPDLLKMLVAYLPWFGGAICCLLLFLLLFGGEKDRGGGQDPVRPEAAETALVIQTANHLIPEASEAVAEPAEIGQPYEDKQTPALGSGLKTSGIKEMVAPSMEQEGVQGLNQTPAVVVDSKAEPQESAELIEAAGNTEKVAADKRTGAAVGAAKETKVFIDPVKDRDLAMSQPHSSLELKETTEPPPEAKLRLPRIIARHKIHKDLAPMVPAVADRLYQDRLTAGLAWTGRKTENMYTVQLMALTSKTSEANLKKLLAQVKYRQEAGNFYIFKKRTAPDEIFVFYGEYPSIERARLVRDSLPGFLRDQRPYALSIKGALAKVRK